MKFLLSFAFLTLSVNVLASDALAILKIKDASSFDLQTADAGYFLMDNDVFVRVSIRQSEGLRGHPEMSIDSHMVKVPGLTINKDAISLNFQGEHTCAVFEEAGSFIRPTQNCKFVFETNSSDEIEVSMVVNQ